jgi:hypothetical protein
MSAADKNSARLRICAAATELSREHAAHVYRVREVQRAVRVCRYWGLVDDDTLIAAGFRVVDR